MKGHHEGAYEVLVADWKWSWRDGEPLSSFSMSWMGSGSVWYTPVTDTCRADIKGHTGEETWAESPSHSVLSLVL